MISYDGIDEAVLVHALYHSAGRCAPHTPAAVIDAAHGGDQVTVEVVWAELVARAASAGQTGFYIDYLRGRPLKIRLDPNTKKFDPRLYDRDAGAGAAQLVVDSLRATATPTSAA